jgi:hypothetical protein
MRDYVTFAKASNHLDLETRYQLTTVRWDFVSFGAVVMDIELPLPMFWPLE